MTKMSTNQECKLNSQLDWECWRWQFQLTARAADLWNLIQRLEASIQKLAEPNINSYSCSASAPPPVQTCSQSQTDNQTTEDFQSTVQQEPQGPVEFAHLTTTGQKSYTTAILMYENKLKAYNTQQLGIQKLIDFTNQIVLSSYLKNYCNLEDNIDTWYANLKKMTSMSKS